MSSAETTFQIVEPKPYHVGQMVHRLRRSCSNLMLSIGQNPKQELRSVFGRSTYRRAWMIDGRLAGLGGVTGTLLSGAGYIWLALSEDALNHKFAMIREARAQLAEALKLFARVETKVIKNDIAAQRFARFMGFRKISEGPAEIVMEMRREWLDPTCNDCSQVAPFFVFGLPRSRTKWLSEFLTAGGWKCHHDSPLFLDTLADFAEHFAAPMLGSVETAMAPAWRFIRAIFPEARFAVVRRPRCAVEGSADAVGLVFDSGYLEDQERHLEEISALPGTVTIEWSELSTEPGARRIYEHCLQRPMDVIRWQRMDAQNIQIDVPRQLCALADRWEKLRGFFEEVASYVTIQLEPFDDFYQDAADLFEQHREEAGSINYLPFDPNIDLARALDRMGLLVCMTARTTREIVGYIVFIVNQSFESRLVLIGQQSIFFVRPDHRGSLGLRLHAAARKELKRRNVSVLAMRSGVRAEGPRLERLFERLGASYMGKLYYLRLGG